MPSRGSIRPRIGILLLLALAPEAVFGSEPEVAFEAKSGWVRFSLRWDGEPIPGATVAVLDARSAPFAEGETDATGSGTVPLPPGSSFLVEVRIGDRKADTVFMTRIDDDVVPNRVMLTFGLKSCCRPASASSPARSFEFPDLFRVIVLAALFAAGTLLLILSRAAQAQPKNSQRKRS